MSLTIAPTNIYNNHYFVNQKSNVVSFKKNSEPETLNKNKIPTLLLTTLALGVGLFALFKLRKSDKTFIKETSQKNLEEIQIQLKNIFGKDFAIDETKTFIQTHKELNKIADNKEYYQKLFEQLKKDFKVENKDLALELWEKPLPVEGGVMNGYTEALTRKIGTTAFEDRIKTFANLFHEFKHVKQNELMYKTDSARLIRAKVAELEKSNNASWQNVLNHCNGDKAKARKMVQEEVKSVYKENWGHLKPISKTSNEYSQGLKYIENEENRIPPGVDYYKQILEKEAQFVEKAAEKLFKQLKDCIL